MNFKFFASIFFALLLTLPASAQDDSTQTTVPAEEVTPAQPAPEQAKPAPTDRVEKLEVTGSHIKRVDVEGPSPVFTIDNESLTKSGYNNIGDVLRDSAMSTFGGEREASLAGGVQSGASTTSLRGFGSDRILVMLDGKRLPPMGGSSAVDLSLIPMSAVERIEVLKDGASAIYGSDALGGVINIITKKNYDGANVELGYTTPETAGGVRSDVKATYGKSFSKGDILGVVQYRNNTATKAKDFDYSRPRRVALSPEGGPPGTDFSYKGSPGTWEDNAGFHAGGGADPCPAGREQDGSCVFDYSPYAQNSPDINQYSALLAGNYNINEELKVFARGIYSHRDVKSQLAPAPDTFRDATNGGTLTQGVINTQISQATAQGWGLNPNSDLNTMDYRLVEEAGPRVNSIQSDSYALQSGINGYFMDSWEWEFSGTHGVSETKDEGISGFANKQILYQMANAGTFNPFAAPGNKSDISAAKYKPFERTISSISTVNLTATGEIIDLPAGPLAVAVGVANAWQTYEQQADAISSSGAQWAGNAPGNGKGLRDFQSVYSEFSLPPFEGMELQAAARFDNYSDFGSTINPKVGFRYKPANMVMLRGTWGTGFRAPALEDLYQFSQIGYPTGTDPITGQKAQFEMTTGGNRKLKEETTQSYNLGMVLEPAKNLSFMVDYWKTKQKNEVLQADVRDIFRAEQAFGRPYLQALGLDVIRAPGTLQVDRIIAPKINASAVDLNGLDFQVNYTLPVFGEYRMNMGMVHSLLLQRLVEAFPGLGREDRVGYYDAPYWKNNVTVAFGNSTYDVTAVVRTIGETNASSQSPVPGTGGKTRDHTELDLRFQYVAPWKGTFSLMVKNVFNTKRPYIFDYRADGYGYLVSNIYDPFGRAFGLTYSHDF